MDMKMIQEELDMTFLKDLEGVEKIEDYKLENLKDLMSASLKRRYFRGHMLNIATVIAFGICGYLNYAVYVSYKVGLERGILFSILLLGVLLFSGIHLREEVKFAQFVIGYAENVLKYKHKEIDADKAFDIKLTMPLYEKIQIITYSIAWGLIILKSAVLKEYIVLLLLLPLVIVGSVVVVIMVRREK